MTKAIGIIGTLDTKWSEIAYVKTEIERRGCRGFLIDVGVFSDWSLQPEVSTEEVAAAGGRQLADLVARRDRGEAMEVMSKGAAVMVKRLHEEGRVDGLIALGGGGGTAISAIAMRTLRVGFAKLLVSDIPIEVSEKAVNDPEFSSRAAERLLELINQKPEHKGRSPQRKSQTTVNE